MLRAPCIDMPVVKPYSIRQHFRIRIPIATHSGRGNRAFTRFLRMLLCVQNEALFLDAPLEKIGRFALCLSCGLTASILVRSGLIFDAAPYDLLVGSALESAILLFAAIYWWIILFRLENEELLANASQSLFCAAIAFLGAIAYAPRCFTSRSGARNPVMHDHVHDKALRERQRNRTRQQV